MQIENPMLNNIIPDSEDDRVIDYCAECHGEIYTKEEAHRITFNREIIHINCFREYFENFIEEVQYGY